MSSCHYSGNDATCLWKVTRQSPFTTAGQRASPTHRSDGYAVLTNNGSPKSFRDCSPAIGVEKVNSAGGLKGRVSSHACQHGIGLRQKP